jgi:hypothetical protein
MADAPLPPTPTQDELDELIFRQAASRGSRRHNPTNPTQEEIIAERSRRALAAMGLAR